MFVFSQISAQEPITFDEFLGINWQNPEPFDDLECVGFVREFHRWASSQGGQQTVPPDPNTLYPNQCLEVDPTIGFPLHTDYVYERFMEMELGISPAMMSSLPTYSGGRGPLEFESRLPIQWIPVFGNPNEPNEITDWDADEPRDAPSSYVERADWMHHYVSRYAENVMPNTQQKVCEPQEERFGLGFIQYVESWNEPDRTWAGDEAEFTPQEYAAMASADFDGHANTIQGEAADGSMYNLGVRNISPTIRFVMGAPFALEYREDGDIYNSENPNSRINVWDKWIEPMRIWFGANRPDGNDFPFDVVNIHHYTVNNPSDFINGLWQSPERNGVRAMIETEVIANMEALGWRDEGNYRELWISEFGYDTSQEDLEGWDFNLESFVNTAYNPEEIQAQWNARTFLEFSAAGVDRAMLHNMIDAARNLEAPWDMHTGLLTVDEEPKISWFYTFAMKNILEGYQFVADESDEDDCDLTAADSECDSPCTRVYRYENDEGDRIWAVWSPTECGREYTREFSVPGLNNDWAAIRLGAPSTEGIVEDLNVNNGTANLTVSEIPLFIVEEGREEIPECPVVLLNDATCSSASFDIQIPTGQNYDSYQVWFGEYDPATDPVFVPNFNAIDGNLTQFGDDYSGDRTRLNLGGLRPSTSYVVYVIPQNRSGIPIITSIDDENVPCATLLETAADVSHCGLPVYDPTFAAIDYGESQNEEFLFDDQRDGNFDFCTTYFNDLEEEIPHGEDVLNDNENPTWESWINFGGDGRNEARIEFLQDNYIIDQLTFFDASSTGLITFDWSLDGTTWFPLTEYYTNRGERFRIRENDDPDTPEVEILEGFGAWQTLSNFEQPETGIRFLRVISTNNRARINELYICGRPACAEGNPIVGSVCNEAEFVTCAESVSFTRLEIQGNSEKETHALPNNSSNFNYPFAFFDEKGLNQLIPGVNYNPVVETCVGANCTTETLSFTANTTDCILDNQPIVETAPFAGRCGSYTLPVDANVGDQVQVWLSHTLAFDDNSVHPLIQDPNAEMMILTVENAGAIGNSISFSYDECEKNVYLAYRYFTDDESSPLFNLSLVTSSAANNLAWYAICDCTGNTNTPTPFFIIDDCRITDVVYDYLEVGEKLRHREIELPSFGSQQLLKNHTHNILNERYTYHLSYPENADRLRFRVSDSSPWANIDLTAVPCITTKNPPTATKNDQTTEAKIELENDLTLYPNPTIDYLNVRIGESANLLLIGVDGKSYDLRELKRTSFGYQFSTSHLTPGLYLLRTIDNAGKIQTGKFLVRE